MQNRNVRQINDEWKDWRRPITQKTRETDRKISPDDPLTEEMDENGFNFALRKSG